MSRPWRRGRDLAPELFMAGIEHSWNAVLTAGLARAMLAAGYRGSAGPETVGVGLVSEGCFRVRHIP
jgi:hypothetical protein